MKTFATLPGVNSFETTGADGSLIRIESGKPYKTDNPVEISILEAYGANALSSSNGAAAPAPKPHAGGDE